ncbi:MAG: CHAD domain-containing protein [Patulibacter sp.]|nr:CHAD domain-containing protein [Patulibacter sp.]
MKARKVVGLDPQGRLADNVERIARARLEELQGFAPAVLDASEVTALHDMRIAAKRLRYLLEATAETCFGDYARTAAKRARDLQEVIGEIHDCDVAIPRVERALEAIEAADEAALFGRAEDAADLDPRRAGDLPHADEHRGLITLLIYLRARRRVLYREFLGAWRAWERDGVRPRLLYALAERPEPITRRSPDDNDSGSTAA